MIVPGMIMVDNAVCFLKPFFQLLASALVCEKGLYSLFSRSGPSVCALSHPCFSRISCGNAPVPGPLVAQLGSIVKAVMAASMVFFICRSYCLVAEIATFSVQIPAEMTSPLSGSTKWMRASSFIPG